MRTVCIAKWGSDQGLAIINKLSHLYTAIVWENDLLGLLSPPYNHTQGRGDLERLIEIIGPNPVISELFAGIFIIFIIIYIIAVHKHKTLEVKFLIRDIV